MHKIAKKRAIVVLGMHRSGTSALTRVLNLCGAALPKQLMPPAPDNETGFWEPAEIIATHEELLVSAGSLWDDVLEFPQSWFTSDIAETFKYRIINILRENFSEAPLFVIKDPRMCRLVPLWLSVFKDFGAEPLFIFVVRNPLEVAASLEVRNGFLPAKSIMLWLRHLLAAEKDTRGMKRAFIGYEDLLTDWRGIVQRLSVELGIHWPHRSRPVDTEIDAFLSSQLRHHVVTCKEVAARTDVVNWVKTTFDWAIRATKGLAKASEELDSVHEALLFADRVFAPLVTANTLEISKLSEDITRQNSQIDQLQQEMRTRQKKARQLTETVNRLEAQVAERDRQIARLQQEVQTRQGDTRQLTETVNVLETQVVERDGQIAQLQQKVQTIQAQHEQLNSMINGLETDIIEREKQIRAIYRSTSWRIAFPIRVIKKTLLAVSQIPHYGRKVFVESIRFNDSSLLLKLFRYIGWRKHRIILRPIHQIVRHGNEFESIGEDPQFLIASTRPRPPSGWALICYSSNAQLHPLMPKIYVDTGEGFSEANTIQLKRIVQGTAHEIIRLPDQVSALRFDPMDKHGKFTINNLDIIEIGKLQLGILLIWRYVIPVLKTPSSTILILKKAMQVMRYGRFSALKNLLVDQVKKESPENYHQWIQYYDTLTNIDHELIQKRIAQMSYKPLISVVMPVYNISIRWLREAIESVRNQLYPHWELCIADDASSKSKIKDILKKYERLDSRIKVVYRESNGHISAASNSALYLATGEFIALIDHDDMLTEHALYLVAEELNKHPDADIIYSDEDKIDEQGQRYGHYFKSDWNPDLFYSQNLISHLGVYRRKLINEIGGFRLGYEGSQDYDLALRVIERTSKDKIRHIPFILYHWRAIRGSTALTPEEKNYAHEAARKALRSHFERLSIKVQVTNGSGTYHRVIYEIPKPAPLVSLIMPTRDRLELLRRSTGDILNNTDYTNLELIIVDNQSNQADTIAFLKNIQSDRRVMVLKYDRPYNFSAINNMAVRKASGEIIGLVNNDIDIITSTWLTEMVSHAIRQEIGVVGAMLYYPNDTIQHAGVVLGIGGVAGHIHKYLPRGISGYSSRAALIQNFSVVTAACMLMRRSVFEEVGGLNEDNLPVAFNDVDLCIRIHNSGYRILWTPYAELYHYESATRGSDHTPEQLPRFVKEVNYMKQRWEDILNNDPYYSPNLSLESGENFSLAYPPRVKRPWLN
jgi:GT2 family glycosyltransferase